MACFTFKSLRLYLRLFDLLLRAADGDLARTDEFLVSVLGLRGLLAVFLELRGDGLQAQRVLAGGVAVAGAQVDGRLVAQILLLGFEALDLRHEPFAERRVAGKPLVVMGNLLAEIFFFHLHERFGILALHPRDEQAHETADDVGQSFEHGLVFSGCSLPGW